MSPVKVVVLAALVGIGFWMALVSACLAADWTGLVLNLGTEIMGAGLIYLVFDWFIGGRERREAKKRQLIDELSSFVQNVAVAAAGVLQRRGWLADGSLQEVYLEGAALQGANLWHADLQRAYLGHADLQGANLGYADLRGAILERAKLQGAYLGRAHFDEDTILPDGTRWTPDTDMARFTDPEHPNFWRSSSRRSPAYQPKEQE